MKKLFTLSFGMLIALVSIARQAQVTVNISNPSSRLLDYEVAIDGRNFSGNNNTITNLNQGQHTVQVYQVVSGLFGSKKRVLKSTSQFQLRDYDVQINVDSRGELSINEYGNNNTNNGGWNGKNDNGGWNNGGYNNNRNCDCQCKRYDHSNGNWNNGRGNKYGHYKKHKHGKGNRKWDDDDRRERDDDEDDDR